MREINVARISILANQLQVIDVTIKELTLKLRELEIESKAKKIELNLLRNEGAAVSSLPNEILALIFQIGRQLPSTYSFRPRNPRFEVLVSHVTHHWRRVALSTPMLWTKMHRTKYQQEFKSILAYLRRSNPAVFQLRISIGADEEHSDTDDEEVRPHLHRCQHLFIESDDSSQGLEILRYFSPTHTPFLQSLRLAYSDALSGVPVNIFEGGAQSLTHIHLTGIALLSCLPPIANVTTLCLDRYGWPRNAKEVQKIAHTLSTMPVLTHLELWNCKYGGDWPSSVSLNLPMLRRLVYNTGGVASDQMSGFLVALNAPLLEDLTLNILSLAYNTLDEAFVLAGQLKFPLVRRLCMSRGFESISNANMRKLARAFPFITELSHSAGELEWRTSRIPEFIAFLQEVDPNHGITWPHLRTLAMPTNTPVLPVVADLESILVKRADFGCPIRTLILPYGHLEQGPILSSCTQPPVQIMQYTDDTTPYFPDWFSRSL